MLAMENQQTFHENNTTNNRELVGKRGDSPLHLAARAGKLDLVKHILDDCHGDSLKDMLSKQNQDGETAMYVAAENGHVHVVKEILKISDNQYAALKSNNGYDSLHIAAKQGHLEVLTELLNQFPDLAMTTDTSNSTALHTVASQGYINIVNLLLQTDASLVKISRSNGKTALHSAARKGHTEVVKSLLSKDPGLGFRTDKKGQTALHMAVKGTSVEVVMELVTPEPEVIGLEDSKGNTALHIATWKGHTQMVQSLLSVKGININTINKKGETPLDIAEKSSNVEIAHILREHGAITAKEFTNPPIAAKQLKQTVSDIKHEVQSQLKQTRQTRMRVQKISKRLKKMHISGLNNAINSATVVAVLIATVAFAAIFTVPGQYVEKTTEDHKISLGQAWIAENMEFIIFFVFDSIALFISLAVVVVQTSIVVIEQKAKKQVMFVINKLMWLACLFISVAFISLSFVVVDHKSLWLAWCVLAIGGSIMLATIGSMSYFVIMHRMEESNHRNIRRASESRSHSWSKSVMSDSELLNNDYKRMYAL